MGMVQCARGQPDQSLVMVMMMRQVAPTRLGLVDTLPAVVLGGCERGVFYRFFRRYYLEILEGKLLWYLVLFYYSICCE